jgi:hypothetical protein
VFVVDMELWEVCEVSKDRRVGEGNGLFLHVGGTLSSQRVWTLRPLCKNSAT